MYMCNWCDFETDSEMILEVHEVRCQREHQKKEFKENNCVWKPVPSMGFIYYKPSCKKHEVSCPPRNYKYCPYCSKQLIFEKG